MTRVYLEVGKRRTFACAVDWPGWARSGRDEASALAALAAYEPRYASVVEAAGVDWGGGNGFEVVERLEGDATTDFGAPGRIPPVDLSPLTADQAGRLVTVWWECWRFFDRTAAGAPAELRKGPRGGGRDRDKIVAHVIGADLAYAYKLGLRPGSSAPEDPAAVRGLREAMAGLVSAAIGPPPAKETRRWPARYAVRRSAWHALDHAWEIEDRSV